MEATLNTQNPNSRRDFFKHLLVLSGAATLSHFLGHTPGFAQSSDKKEPELIDMTGKKRKDPTNETCVKAAKSINYYDKAEDLEKAIKAKTVKFTPPTFKDKTGKDIPLQKRTCDTCALFALTNPKLNTCALINGCLVAPKGSCTSWSLKPGTL